MQKANLNKPGSSSSDPEEEEEDVVEEDFEDDDKGSKSQSKLPGKNEDLDFGEMLSLDDEDYSDEEEGVGDLTFKPAPSSSSLLLMSKLRANSEASSSSSICTDDDVVQKRKKRGVRGMLSMNQEDDYSDQSSNESSSKNSFTDEDEFGEHEEVENLFDETFEELCILEAKQLRANAAAAIDAANQKNPTSQRTLDVLRTVPFFAQFSLEHQEQLFSELQEESFTDGVNIVSQGELGDKFYVIVQGEAVVSKMDEFGEFRDLTHIYAGDFFGELVLIYGGERVATVTSVGRTKCMSLSKRSFEKYADIRYFLILQKVPLLAGLAREVQLEIVRRLKPAKFNPDELVVKQHDRGDAFFFITRGSALVFDEDDGDKIITRLYEGHSFGEMALMSDAPRVASVRSGSATELHCMFLSVQDFKELLSAEEFAELVDRESKKIRELRDKRTLFKQMRANSTNSFDTMGSPFRDADASPGDPKRLRAGSSQLAMPSANSPLLSPNTTPRTAAGMQQKLKTGKTLGGSKIVNNYVLGEQIGKGTFGIVRLCENNGHQYAIKIIDKSLFKNKVSSKHQSTMEDMRREASIMKKLDHPNVVNLIDVIDDPKAEQLYLVQEFCAGGAVMENLEGSSPLEEPLARRYFRDLLCGIDYLHAHQIIHRDIKPMNLLITSTGLLKIGDFGAARVLSSDSKQTLGIAGTPAFMAPELLGQEPSLYDGPAVDLWSCGATLFMLVTGVPPWMASDELTLAKRVQNDELVFPGAFATKLNPHLRNLLTRLLVKDPAQRMTLTQTMLHEWVTEEGADPLERFVDLQPQLIRVNSKRLMSPPRQLSPTLSSAVAAAVAGLTQDVNQQLNSAIAASTANTTTTTTATESQFSAASEDSDDLDAITLVHNDSTPFMSSGLRKRYNHRTFPDGDVSMNTGSPGSPVVHVGDDLSEMFALSPTTARHSPPFHRPAPLLSLQGHKEPSPTSDGNSQGMERVDSLDYAQIDVGRGCMTNTKNPAAADSTGTMYSTASSGGSRHLPHTSSGLAHSPNISSASLHQQQLLLQRQQPSSKGKKDVVDAFTKRHMSSSGGLKRHVGGSRGSSTDLRGAMDVYANKRAALGPRTLTGESSSTFNGRQVTSSRSRPRPDSPPQRQATILSFMDDADFMEVEDHDVDVDDEDEHEHMDKGEENDGMEEDSLEEDLDEEEDCVRPRSFGNGPFDMTIQPLPFGAPAIIKARRGSVVSHCRIKYGYGEDQGLRSSMEDFIAIVPKLKKPETFFAAVFDGHGGDRVAKELKARLHRVLGASPEFATDLPTAIKKTCLGLDRAMLHYAASELLDLESKIQLGDQQKSLFRTKGGGSKHMESAADLLRKTGSTAVIALVRSLELTVAWVGDSRAVLCRAGSAVEVSRDHKASRTDEMQRIRDFGGTVDRQGRLYGDLAVSRAFGDLQHKGRELRTIFTEGASGPEEFFGAEGTLIALPDITTLQLTPQDEFLILASDGIWDVMSSEEAVNFVRFHLHKHGDVRKAAMELVDKAVEMHSMDNVSAVVLAFGGKKS